MTIESVYQLQDYEDRREALRVADVDTARDSTRVTVARLIPPNPPIVEEPESSYEQEPEKHEGTRLAQEAHRPIYYGIRESEVTLERTRAIASRILSDNLDDQRLTADLDRLLEQVRHVARSLVVRKQAKRSVGERTPQLLDEVEVLPEPAHETHNDEPSWMAEVRALRASGDIPDYQGKRADGDAYEFYKKHYQPWLSKMNQQLLRKLGDKKLFPGLAYASRERGVSLCSLIPASNK